MIWAFWYLVAGLVFLCWLHMTLGTEELFEDFNKPAFVIFAVVAWPVGLLGSIAGMFGK